MGKRSFVLLDERRIKTLVGPEAEEGSRTILAALKYFDILEQKLYFVDWLRVDTEYNLSFGDIEDYIKSELIPNTMAGGGCLQSLCDRNGKKLRFQFFEESAAYFK